MKLFRHNNVAARNSSVASVSPINSKLLLEFLVVGLIFLCTFEIKDDCLLSSVDEEHFIDKELFCDEELELAPKPEN